MANIQRNVFLVSDSTGITLEKLSHSLLSQFPQVDFTVATHRYINSTARLEPICDHIKQACHKDPLKPLVFSSLLNKTHRAMLTATGVAHFDVFNAFLDDLHVALDLNPTPVSGLSHGVADKVHYELRIEAINYTLQSDDGLHTDSYQQADVILLGISRTGKTPTCLYLAINYGIFAANYPITEEDWQNSETPEVIKNYQNKCFGLTIDAKQLVHIRNKRLPGSEYASLAQCQRELQFASRLFAEHNIPWLDSSTTSIEELATSILSIKPGSDPGFH